MDFQINNQQQFCLRLQEFLDDLRTRNYSETTISGYKSFLKKVLMYISQAESTYTLKTSQLFGDEIVPKLLLSESSKEHIRINIRRFNDYLSWQPYVFRKSSDRNEPPEIFQKVLDDYVADGVPYPIVQKILGHADPNSTKRYVAIDIERLRNCSLECPKATGHFLSYLEGGEWQ